MNRDIFEDLKHRHSTRGLKNNNKIRKNYISKAIDKLTEDTKPSESNSSDILALAYHVVFESDEELAENAVNIHVRIENLSMIAKEMEKHTNDEYPDPALFSVYATCVEKLAKLTWEIKPPDDFEKYNHWLKRWIYANEKMVSFEPENIEYRITLATSLDKFGDTREQPRNAERYYKKAFEQRQKVVQLKQRIYH